jgi:hypothetical protein
VRHAQSASPLRRLVGSALFVQVAWAALSAAWNFAGVWLMASGARAPGPTASLGAAVVLLAIAGMFVHLADRRPLLYAVATVVTGLFAAAAIYNAFTASPSLWPSEFWRWAGIVLNGAGFLAALAAVVGFARWTSASRASNRTD